MKKCLVYSVTMAIAALAYAGAAGLVIKGVSHSWDEIAKMALKVSGRELTDDAVKSAAKTIEHATGKYGDDVAKASVRGGVEISEIYFANKPFVWSFGFIKINFFSNKLKFIILFPFIVYILGYGIKD